MSLSVKELERAGKKLLYPPPSVVHLLAILDKAVQIISRIEQAPPRSTMSSLGPLMEALVAPKLLRHSDLDVKVAVAACLSEISRITTQDITYNDDQMKEISQLIVSSFEHLHDTSSRSYANRILILDTVSTLKYCSVMMDLECDALLFEMFQHFLNGIRDDHPMKAFLHMESIMTYVLEESDDIPPEMLLLILRYVKKDSEIPQVSRRLAEQVLISCARELKTCLAEAVKSSGFSLDNYSKVVSSICEGAFSDLKQNAVVAHRKEDGQSPTEVAVKDKEKAAEVSTSIPSSHENGHDEAAYPRRETVAEAGVKTRERRTHEISEEEEEDPAESETPTHKPAQAGESGRFEEAHVETERTAAEGTPSCGTDKFNPQPCSFVHQLDKVRQSIANTSTNVGQFRSELETKAQSTAFTTTIVGKFLSEIKKMEGYLEGWLQGLNVLGEKISVIHKRLDS